MLLIQSCFPWFGRKKRHQKNSEPQIAGQNSDIFESNATIQVPEETHNVSYSAKKKLLMLKSIHYNIFKWKSKKVVDADLLPSLSPGQEEVIKCPVTTGIAAPCSPQPAKRSPQHSLAIEPNASSSHEPYASQEDISSSLSQQDMAYYDKVVHIESPIVPSIPVHEGLQKIPLPISQQPQSVVQKDNINQNSHHLPEVKAPLNFPDSLLAAVKEQHQLHKNSIDHPEPKRAFQRAIFPPYQASNSCHSLGYQPFGTSARPISVDELDRPHPLRKYPYNKSLQNCLVRNTILEEDDDIFHPVPSPSTSRTSELEKLLGSGKQPFRHLNIDDDDEIFNNRPSASLMRPKSSSDDTYSGSEESYKKPFYTTKCPPVPPINIKNPIYIKPPPPPPPEKSNSSKESNSSATDNSSSPREVGSLPSDKSTNGKPNDDAKKKKINVKEEVKALFAHKIPLPKRFLEQYVKWGAFLGEGGFGFVVTAFNRHGKEVAIKFILKDSIPGDSWSYDHEFGPVPFEVYASKHIHHPNIVQFIDMFEVAYYFMLVTEYHGTPWDINNPALSPVTNPGIKTIPADVEPEVAEQNMLLRRRTSCDLFECIEAHSHLSSYAMKKIFFDLCHAVKYLHDRELVHRDLKDENVVVDENYNIRLIDLGSIAVIPKRPRDYFTRFRGTMDFAAPELIMNQPYRGPEVEIWALGVILYAMNFKVNPFKTPKDILERNLIFPSDADPVVVDLIDRMLDADIYRRITLPQVIRHPWFRS